MKFKLEEFHLLWEELETIAELKRISMADVTLGYKTQELKEKFMYDPGSLTLSELSKIFRILGVDFKLELS